MELKLLRVCWCPGSRWMAGWLDSWPFGWWIQNSFRTRIFRSIGLKMKENSFETERAKNMNNLSPFGCENYFTFILLYNMFSSIEMLLLLPILRSPFRPKQFVFVVDQMPNGKSANLFSSVQFNPSHTLRRQNNKFPWFGSSSSSSSSWATNRHHRHQFAVQLREDRTNGQKDWKISIVEYKIPVVSRTVALIPFQYWLVLSSLSSSSWARFSNWTIRCPHSRNKFGRIKSTDKLRF